MADNTGKMVTITYKGLLDSGWQFISAPEDHPISFPCEPGWMPPAFIDTVRTMEIGETRMAHVGSDEAYEERTDERILKVPRSNLAKDTSLRPGDVTTLTSPDGREFPARLVSLDEQEAVFDMNHDAVGQGMHFEITLLAVRDIAR